jgi:hypothetical protein
MISAFSPGKSPFWGIVFKGKTSWKIIQRDRILFRQDLKGNDQDLNRQASNREQIGFRVYM